MKQNKTRGIGQPTALCVWSEHPGARSPRPGRDPSLCATPACSPAGPRRLPGLAAELFRPNSEMFFPLKNSQKSFPSAQFEPQRHTIPQSMLFPERPSISPWPDPQLPEARLPRPGLQPRGSAPGHPGLPLPLPLQAQKGPVFHQTQKSHSPTGWAQPGSRQGGQVTSEGSRRRWGLQRADLWEGGTEVTSCWAAWVTGEGTGA